MVLWYVCFFMFRSTRRGQSAVVLVLKHLRRWGHNLKSHRTDWEKPEIEPATPGLQGGFCIYFYQTLIKYMKGFKSYRGFF